jgi:hypothetical protein
MEGWMTDVFYLNSIRIGGELPCGNKVHKGSRGYKATIRGYIFVKEKRCYEMVCCCGKSFYGTLTGGFKEADDDRYPTA